MNQTALADATAERCAAYGYRVVAAHQLSGSRPGNVIHFAADPPAQ